MRLQAEQAGPGGGGDNGFHLRGRPEPQRPAAAERTSPRAGSGCGLRLPAGRPGREGEGGRPRAAEGGRRAGGPGLGGRPGGGRGRSGRTGRSCLGLEKVAVKVMGGGGPGVWGTCGPWRGVRGRIEMGRAKFSRRRPDFLRASSSL